MVILGVFSAVSGFIQPSLIISFELESHGHLHLHWGIIPYLLMPRWKNVGRPDQEYTMYLRKWLKLEQITSRQPVRYLGYIWMLKFTSVS